MTDADQKQLDNARKRAARRSNERIKLAASFLNGIGIASIVVAIISPTVSNPHGLSAGQVLVGMVVAAILHAAAQLMLGRLRSED